MALVNEGQIRGELARKNGLKAEDIKAWSERMAISSSGASLSNLIDSSRQPLSGQRLKALDDWAALAELACATGLLPKGKIIALKDVQVLITYNPLIVEPYVSTMLFMSPEFDVEIRRDARREATIWKAYSGANNLKDPKQDSAKAFKNFDSRFDQIKYDYDQLLRRAMRTREEELIRLNEIAERYGKYPPTRSI